MRVMDCQYRSETRSNPLLPFVRFERKVESRKAERAGSDGSGGRPDCAFAGSWNMIVAAWGVVSAPAAAVESGGAKG